MQIYTKVVYLDDKCVLIIALRDDQEQVRKRYVRGYSTNNIWSLQISYVQKNNLSLLVIIPFFFICWSFLARLNMPRQTSSDTC